MAVSIAYGIAFATILTLIVLPIFLSFGNSVKTTAKWLYTNREVTKEEVERVVREGVVEPQLEHQSEFLESNPSSNLVKQINNSDDF
jgi:predicted RND superfamily exporter protein